MSAHDHIVMNGGRSIIHVSMCDFAGLRLVKVKALNSQRFHWIVIGIQSKRAPDADGWMHHAMHARDPRKSDMLA